jgi:diguanylate cyclase (GGDEF)-like protein/PAS domain S-box-containing protein
VQILLIEPDPAAVLLLRRRLERLGHTVVAVLAELPAAQRIGADLIPDVVLASRHLPGGEQAARRVSDQLHLPIVLLSRERASEHSDNPEILHSPWDDHSISVALELAHHRRNLERRLRAREQGFRTILTSISDGVVVTDTAGNITFVNQVAATLIGLHSGCAVGCSLDELLTLIDAETGMPEGDLVRRTLALGSLAPAAPLTLLAKDMQEWPVEVSAAPIRDDTNHLTGIVVILREVSVRRAVEEAMRRSHAQLAATVARLERQTHEISVLTALGNDFQRCATLSEAYGAIAAAAHRLFPEDDGAIFVQRVDTHTFEKVARWGAELTPAEGDVLMVPLTAQNEVLGMLHLRLAQHSVDAGYEVSRTVHAARQRLVVALAEQAALGLANVRLRQKLTEQAIRDPLTGLFNRRYMEETLERELHRTARDHHVISLVMLDIDHFKQVNDTYGHEVGDAVLRAVGALLLGAVRTEDIVCRYGGEEFLLVMPNATQNAAIMRAAQICHDVRELRITHGSAILGPITISAGVSQIAHPDTSVADALRAADLALYRAKRAGRNRVEAA